MPSVYVLRIGSEIVIVDVNIILMWYCGLSMVSKLDGNSEIGAHVRSNLCYTICLRHLIIWRAFTNRIFFLRKDIFFFMRERNMHELPSN